MGCDRLPLIDRAALIRFEMAKTHPTQVRRINKLRHSVTNDRKQSPHSRVEQKRLLVSYQKLAKAEVEVGKVSINTEYIWCNFVDSCHIKHLPNNTRVIIRRNVLPLLKLSPL